VTVPWNTFGFTGDVPVQAIADPYNRLSESSESNNQATTSFAILTRPDVSVADFGLADLEIVEGITQTASLEVTNSGQTAAGTAMYALYDGNPETGGMLIGEGALTLDAGGTGTVDVVWTPSGLGQHRLFAISDSMDAVNESNEGNNLSWLDVYVGLTDPILLDSGSAGEPAFSPTTGYGYVDEGQTDMIFTCGAGTNPVETSRRDPLGEVVYQFEHLLTGHTYHLDITLYECDGAGRQESVFVDGYQLAGSIDLGDRQIHRLSLLLDPAFYIDHKIRVTVQAPGIDGALVSEVNLHDIDYRYADAGGYLDPPYTPAQGYGWLDGIASHAWGILPYQTTRVEQNDNELRYQFDNMDPANQYNLNLTFYQPGAPGRIQEVWIDGAFSGLTVDTWDFQTHRETISIPVSAYSTDGSVLVSIKRTDASSGAMVNEISLEEETLSLSSGCFVTPTPYFSQAYGAVTVSGQPAPTGTIVQALNPRGETVGCFTVGSAGSYGFMRIYGEDTSVNPAIPGMRDNELVIFTVNGEDAVSTPLLNWHDDRANHNIALASGGIQGQSILMRTGWNLTSLNVEPAYPLVNLVLDSIDGRYDRVLGETGIYDISLPPEFITLRELHGGQGYYIHMTSTTSANLLVNGLPIPASTPIPLHQGWNWIGYYPSGVLPIAEALQSIDGMYQMVHSLDATYDPSLPPYSTLTEMAPGQGYLIYMNQATTLVYPTGTSSQLTEGGQDAVTAATEDACDNVMISPEFTVVYGDVTVNGAPVRAGTKIEIVTPRGEVAGCRVVTQAGIMGMTHIYGAYEDTVSGFEPGEELSFRLNGIPVQSDPVLVWQGDMEAHPVMIEASWPTIYIPFVNLGQ